VVKEHIQNPNLIKHCLATEAVLRALANRLGEKSDKWGWAWIPANFQEMKSAFE
jgi:predicted hydrolase (HD superfamily)